MQDSKVRATPAAKGHYPLRRDCDTVELDQGDCGCIGINDFKCVTVILVHGVATRIIQY